MLNRFARNARPALVAVVALFLIVGVSFAANGLRQSGQAVENAGPSRLPRWLSRPAGARGLSSS